MGNNNPWKLRDVARGTWKGLTLGTNDPWVAAGTGTLGLAGLGYLLGPEVLKRINPALASEPQQDLQHRGMTAGLLGGAALAATPAILNWYGSRKQAGEITRQYVPYGQAMQNIAEQDTMHPGYKFEFAKAVDTAANHDPTGLVPITSIARGLMGFGVGRLGSALGGALIGANPQTQKTLNSIGGWAGAAAAIPGLIDWSR